MTQILTVRNEPSQKTNYFQIIEIPVSKQNVLTDLFDNEKIAWETLFIKSNTSYFLVNAIEKLGRLLRSNKDYTFFTVSNEDFKKILSECINNGYKIDNTDFLKYPFYEDEVEIERVENLFFSGDTKEIIKFIDNEKIEINKIAFIKESLQLTIYRTGLIWFTGDMIKLNNLLQNALK